MLRRFLEHLQLDLTEALKWKGGDCLILRDKKRQCSCELFIGMSEIVFFDEGRRCQFNTKQVFSFLVLS